MNREIRIPKQKRSIEKKNRLIASAYKLFNEKGYHNTNTAEIAAEAGLSTGCLYDYFVDKDDIFLDAVRVHNKETREIIRTHLAELSFEMDLEEFMKQFLLIVMEAHNHSKGFHREVMALSLTKPEIESVLEAYDTPMTISFFETYLQKKGLQLKNSNEKIHLLLSTVDSTCHDLVYKEKNGVNLEIYRNECAHMLASIFSEKG